MRLQYLTACLCVMLMAGCSANVERDANQNDTSAHELLEIESRQIGSVDVMHGRELANPYGWLEDTDALEVKEWVKRQDERTLVHLKPALDDIEALETRLFNYSIQPRANTAMRRGDLFFFMMEPDAHNEPALFLNDGSEDKLIASSADFSSVEMSNVQIYNFNVSPDGRYVAIIGFEPTTTRRVMRLLDVSTLQYLPFMAEGARFSHSPWAHDSQSVFYAVRNGNDRAAEVRQLRLDGEDVAIVTAENNRKIRYRVDVAGQDGIVITGRSNENEYLTTWVNQSSHDSSVELFSSNGYTRFLGWVDDSGYFLTTNETTGRNEIYRTRRQGKTAVRQRILEVTEFSIAEAYLFGGKLVFNGLEETTPTIRMYDLNGAYLKSITPPYGLVWTNFPTGQTPLIGDVNGRFAYLGSVALDAPGIYEIDLDSLEMQVWRSNGGENTGDVRITRDVYVSADGTSVPVSLTYLRSTKWDGSAPTLVWVYGAHAFTATPYFNAFFKVFIEEGGILVMPQVRGGGVYGPEWHQAGSRAQKQNTVDDTIAALEWLIEKNVSQADHIALIGNSAGTVPVATVGLKRSDLVAAIILEIPVADLVRHNKWSGGWNTEFGDPEILAEFDAMLGFSPYELGLRANEAPATMIFAGENDNVAPPQHGYKLTAALQRIETNAAPILLRSVAGAGHQIGVNQTQRTENQALQLAFLHQQIGWAPR